MPKWYMYIYLISKWMGSKVEIKWIMWQKICLLIILGPGGEIYCLLGLTDYSLDPQKPITHLYYIAVMRIMIKTCTFYEVAVYNSLQPIICKFIIWHTKPWTTHTLGQLLKQISVNKNQPRKGCNRKGILNWPCQALILNIHWETRIQTYGYTYIHNVKLTHFGRWYDIIFFHESLTVQTKPGLAKFLNNIMQIKICLVVLYWIMEGHKISWTETHSGLELR